MSNLKKSYTSADWLSLSKPCPYLAGTKEGQPFDRLRETGAIA